MPCCDSQNTPSPRFFAEIFNKTTPKGHFLSIDTSVFNILTPNDPDLPRNLVDDPDGRERFRKYLPFPSFVNTIEDYPYPYVIGRLCWEFPCVVPSDWEAQHLQKPNNPKPLEDLKAALDATVIKQGVFNLVFHPHGWIKRSRSSTDRPRGQDARQEGQVPELPRGAGAAGQEPARRPAAAGQRTGGITASGCST